MSNNTHYSEQYANSLGDFTAKLLRDNMNRPRQSVLDTCYKIGYLDSEEREVVIYYRVINMPVSFQSEECRDGYTVEQVKHNGEVLPMDMDYEEECTLHLNLLNPMQIRF